MSRFLRDHKAEAMLCLYACLFSTSAARPMAAVMSAFGLALAAESGVPAAALLVALPLALGAAASILFGASPGPALESSGVLLGGFGWFVAAEEPAEGRGLVSAVVAVSLAALSLFERLYNGGSPWLWMVSPIDLAIAILLPALFGFQALSSHSARAVYLAIVLAAVAASTSRALGLAAAAGLLVLLPARLRVKALLVVLFAAILLPLAVRRVSADPLAWHRWSIYAAASGLIVERPWTGWGLGAFDDVARRAFLVDPLPIRRMRVTPYAHCEPLELVFELGVPLASLVIALWIALARRRARDRAATSALVTVSVVSLFYFPLRLVYPLFHALHAMRPPGDAPPVKPPLRILFSAAALLMLVYAAGLALRIPALAPFDGAVALRSGAPSAVDDLMRLEPERPEAHVAAAMRAARAGDPGGAIRSFEAAVGRAPTEAPIRFELARAWLWSRSLARDSAAARDADARVAHELGFIRAVEPLQLAALDAVGDTLGFALADIELMNLERASEPAGNIAFMRRRLAL